MDRISHGSRNISDNNRVKDWIRHYHTSDQAHALPRTEAPPMRERMSIDCLLDDNKQALTQTEIYRNLRPVEINADKLRDYIDLYMEYKIQREYQNEWNAAHELGKRVFCILDIMEDIYVFRDKNTVSVGTNVSNMISQLRISNRNRPKASELQEGQSYDGVTYLGNKIGPFDPGNDQLTFDIGAPSWVKPVEFIDNLPADKKGVYFTNNYNMVLKEVLGDKYAKNDLSRLYTDTKRNYVRGFQRWDLDAINQERRNQTS